MHRYAVVPGDDFADLSSEPASSPSQLSPRVVTFVALALLSFLITIKYSIFGSAAWQKPELPTQAKDVSKSYSVLMVSYPNSGTTYTMQNTQTISNLSVAYNYPSPSSKDDPVFLSEPYKSPIIGSSVLNLPRLVLTKTHCHCYNLECSPEADPKGFEQSCMSVLIFEEGKPRPIPVRYHELPAKGVHLVRDPHDNLVARMHFANDHSNLDVKYSRDEAGFREWCSYVDSFPPVRNAMKRQLNVSDYLFDNLPCISDYWRYVIWHNNAIAMFNRRDYPLLTLHYEDYSLNYQSTVDTLFEFLELDQVNPPAPFIANKSYHSYFTEEQKELAGIFVRKAATPECWKILQRYF